MIPDWAIRTKADKRAIAEGCYWDQEKADSIIRFAETIYQTQFLKRKLNLLDWQRRLLMSLYGWRDRFGNRRWKVANLHIAKKNGKTMIVSICSGYELLCSDEVSPFVVSGSTTAKNATQVFSELHHTIQKEKLLRYCKVSKAQKTIYFPKTNARYEALASEGGGVQGYNCSFVVLDELHAHENSSLYDSLRYSTTARPNGLLFIISTAGDDISHFYYEIYSKSKRILNGEDEDITHYAEIYESDKDSDPEDKEQWRKANPSMDVAFPESNFALELKSAQSDPVEFNRFKRYRLNQWIRPDEKAYFPIAEWDECKRTLDDDYLRRYPAWIGVDLSQTTDPSSVSICIALPDRKYFGQSWGFVCQDGVEQRNKSNLPKYHQFRRQDEFVITEGDRIDDHLIYKHILSLIHKYDVRLVIFDPTSAMIMMGWLESEGVKVHRMYQSYGNYSAPMKEFHKAIMERRISHNGNLWLRYCLSNVRVDEDSTGKIRPVKKKSIDKIDGAIAILMAYSQAAQQPAEAEISRYQTQGIEYF